MGAFLTCAPREFGFRLIGWDAQLGITVLRLTMGGARMAKLRGVPFRPWDALSDDDRKVIGDA